MPRASALVVFRAFTLLALAATAALVVEYRSVDTAFCAAGSGCAELRRTALAYLWGIGITLPEFGLLGLATVFALSLSRWLRWALRLSLVGAAVAAVLLLMQAVVLKRFCWLCVTTDLASLTAGVAAFRAQREHDALDAMGPLRPWAWAALAASAILLPAAWPRLRPTPPVPPGIRALYEPGKINVVEFADFQCPFCRNLHHRLKPLLARYGDRVHFVRLNMPLDGHVHARDAALAALCAPPAMAAAFTDFLFTTEDLSVEAIRREALKLGIDLASFDGCRAARATAQKLARDMSIVREAGLLGLPTTYIGGQRIVGAQSDETFSAALALAERGADQHGIPAIAYVLFSLAVILALVRLGYRRPASPSSASDTRPPERTAASPDPRARS